MKAAISAAQANDAKLARMELPGHPHHAPPPPPPHLFGDPFAQHAAALAGLSFQGSQMERLERERREQEMRAIAMSIAASPLTVTSSMRSPLGHGNPYGPPPGFTAHQVQPDIFEKAHSYLYTQVAQNLFVFYILYLAILKLLLKVFIFNFSAQPSGSGSGCRGPKTGGICSFKSRAPVRSPGHRSTRQTSDGRS